MSTETMMSTERSGIDPGTGDITRERWGGAPAYIPTRYTPWI